MKLDALGRLSKLLGTVRTPLQAALMTYVGAIDMAGVAMVVTVMLTPARAALQEAIEPVIQPVIRKPAKPARP